MPASPSGHQAGQVRNDDVADFLNDAALFSALSAAPAPVSRVREILAKIEYHLDRYTEDMT